MFAKVFEREETLWKRETVGGRTLRSLFASAPSLLEKYLSGSFPRKHEVRKNKIEQVEEGALSLSLMCASDSTLDLLEGVFVAGMVR